MATAHARHVIGEMVFGCARSGVDNGVTYGSLVGSTAGSTEVFGGGRGGGGL